MLFLLLYFVLRYAMYVSQRLFISFYFDQILKQKYFKMITKSYKI